MSQLHDLTALDAVAAMERGEVSPVELTEHYLERIGRLDGEVGAFVRLTAGSARAQALEAEHQLRGGDRSLRRPLHGIPGAVKDLNAVAGVPMSYGSAIMREVVPDYDDFVVTKMVAAGLISLGKTSTPEFGLPCYTETDIGPPARTPWDLDRLAGGSSGGAAAAVAAGFVPIAQGSDGGGSIRIPAAACGVVGLKPSRGRISGGPLAGDPAGLVTNGVLARTVRDAAAFLDAVAGPMPGDAQWASTLPPGDTFLAGCRCPPSRLRIGRYLDAPMVGQIDPQIVAAWEDASHRLADLGHEIVDVRAPFPAEAVSMFETVWSVGAASFPLSDSQEAQLRPLTRHLRERGRSVQATVFAQALAGVAGLSRQAIASSAEFDAVLTPTLAQLPRPVGYFTDGREPAEDFELQKQYTPWTAMYNMTGQPAVSLPLYSSAAGATPDDTVGNLPIAMMLVGRAGGDEGLLALAAQIEDANPWRDRHPPIWYR